LNGATHERGFDQQRLADGSFVRQEDITMTYHTDTYSAAQRGQSDKWEFRLFFMATFVAMLLSTVISRLIPSRQIHAGHRGSIFHEANARTNRILPFLFMS
jgi:hypothetical protein